MKTRREGKKERKKSFTCNYASELQNKPERMSIIGKKISTKHKTEETEI